MDKKKKIFLTIAGSDPIGGAGIQVDIKTACRLGVYACSAITAVTAQNTSMFSDVWEIKSKELRAQLTSILEDIRPDAVKIGLLPSERAVSVISECISEFNLSNVVLDPVISPTLKKIKPERNLIHRLITELFPLTSLVTPNAHELEIIESVAGISMDNLCNAYLLKGGHFDSGQDCKDILYFRENIHYNDEWENETPDIEEREFKIATSSPFPTISPHPFASLDIGGSLSPYGTPGHSMQIKEFTHPRIKTSNTHGSGCVLSSAIACYLAEGFVLIEAVDKGIRFLVSVMEESKDYSIGKGKYGPVLI